MPNAFELQRFPFREGEPVIIVEPRGRRHYVQLRSGVRFHHKRMGHVAHRDIIGQPPGLLLTSDSGERAVCLRPTLEDHIFKGLRRRTSVIHPKDLAPLLIRGDVYPGASVLEAGAGSGACSIFLLRHLGPHGALTSYERREEFAELARQNVESFHRLYGGSGATHRIVDGDVYEPIPERDQDLALLDLPEPHLALPVCVEALRPGGVLMCWLPTVTQVYRLALALEQDSRWTGVETTETLERGWKVEENAMRPHHRMIAHTGFWIRARKLVAPEWDRER